MRVIIYFTRMYYMDIFYEESINSIKKRILEENGYKYTLANDLYLTYCGNVFDDNSNISNYDVKDNSIITAYFKLRSFGGRL